MAFIMTKSGMPLAKIEWHKDSSFTLSAYGFEVRGTDVQESLAELLEQIDQERMRLDAGRTG